VRDGKRKDVSGARCRSSLIIAALALRLPDEAIAPAGTPAEEAEEIFGRPFHEMYGIHVEEFLALRRDADAATTQQLGDAPVLGELVSDEWFVQRDITLLEIWNDRHPESARAYCDLISVDTP
jgi:hypothetical protein